MSPQPYSKKMQLGARKKREPRRLKRRTPLTRVAMKRCGPRTKKSGGHLFYRSGRCPEYLAALRTQPCRVCKLWGLLQVTRTQAAHVIPRARGGEDLGNALSLCARHHDEQGRIGIGPFERKWLISMEWEAAGQTLWFLERGT